MRHKTRHIDKETTFLDILVGLSMQKCNTKRVASKTFLDIKAGQSFQDILVGMGMQKSDTKNTPFAKTKDRPGHPGWSTLPGHSG
jgi:predicted transcriptional regulator